MFNKPFNRSDLIFLPNTNIYIITLPDKNNIQKRLRVKIRKNTGPATEIKKKIQNANNNICYKHKPKNIDT